MHAHPFDSNSTLLLVAQLCIGSQQSLHSAEEEKKKQTLSLTTPTDTTNDTPESLIAHLEPSLLEQIPQNIRTTHSAHHFSPDSLVSHLPAAGIYFTGPFSPLFPLRRLYLFSLSLPSGVSVHHHIHVYTSVFAPQQCTLSSGHPLDDHWHPQTERKI